MPARPQHLLPVLLLVSTACGADVPPGESAGLGSDGTTSGPEATGWMPTSGGISASADESSESTTGDAESSSAATSDGPSGDEPASDESSSDGSDSSSSTGPSPDVPPPTATLTVDKAGAGGGAVRSEPDGILCGPSCETTFDVGTMVTLTAQSNGASRFAGWSGGDCDGADECVFVLEADTVIEASFEPNQPNLVFATSAQVAPMDIGGLDGADQICADAATDAGLTGTYVAWLSTSTVDAQDRLGAARGWVRPDGRPFADTIADLTGHVDYYPPRLDEYGNDLEGASIITGTSTNGTGPHFSTFCADWTDDDDGLIGGGSADAGSGAWTQLWSFNCSTPRHLLCFGVDQDFAVSVDPVVGRAAFVTTDDLAGTIGIDALDDACQAEADDAGLAGSFLAAVATSTDSIASRFDTDGSPWVRHDGVAIVASADELDELEHLRAPLLQTADGTRVTGGVGVWTGGASSYESGPGQDTCGDWSDPDIGNGWGGFVTESAWWTTAGGRQSCASALNRLYCLEQ